MSKRQIVWAIDPFAKDLTHQQASLAAIEQFAGGEDTAITPICVWRETQIEDLEGVSHLNLKKHCELGDVRIQGLVGAKNLNVRPLEMVAKPFTSLRDGAKDLVERAKKIGAEMIVLSTHARKGPERWFLGSFAETLSLISDVPLLIARPGWKTRTGSKNILFLTDFSRESAIAFDQLVRTAKEHEWSITLFHLVKYDYYPGSELAFAAWDIYLNAYREETSVKISQANELAERGRKKGVKVSVIVETDRLGSVDQMALDLLQKNHLFVALASHSGFFTRAFLGSTTRQLIRNSPVPVWVIHPEERKSKSKGAPLGALRDRDGKTLPGVGQSIF